MMSTTTISPPSYRYSTSSRAGQDPSDVPECLPAYSRRRSSLAPPRRSVTEHTFPLVDGRHTWASLSLQSCAKSSKSLPLFYERDTISGSLDIDADKTDSIHSIVATVSGRLVTATGSDDVQFLNVVFPIWSKSPNGPRTPSPSEGANGSKLRGKCSWPLSIPLPRETMVSGRSCRLPETLSERGLAVSVQYEITIRFGRGKLRSDTRLTTPFAYVPCTRPEAPSPLRQLAYQENYVLPGPFVDPRGWKSVNEVFIRGLMFGKRNASAKLTIFLALPLSYTRGSVLPCSVTIDCVDPQLLDLLSAPESIPLSLCRSVHHSGKALPTMLGSVGQNKEQTIVGSSVWWRSVTRPASPTTRNLDGEIRLSKDLKPTAAVGPFNLSYNVILGPLRLPGISNPSIDGTICEPVEITTKYAHGPRPKAHSPPGYTHDYSSARSPSDIQFYIASNISASR